MTPYARWVHALGLVPLTLLCLLICGVAWLGARLDPVANQQNAAIISAPDSTFTMAIEPTNEEWVAAQHAWELIGLGWR